MPPRQTDTKHATMPSSNDNEEADEGITDNLTSANAEKGALLKTIHDNSSGDQLVTPATPSAAGSHSSIESMPFDIIAQIFEVDFCAAVCTGLTCTKFYAFFKNYHGDKPVPLRTLINYPPGTPSFGFLGRDYLGDLLVDWAGSRYRFSADTVDRLLNIEIYGTEIGNQDINLRRRYLDYSTSKYDARKGYGRPDYALPNPHNKGLAWYEEALAVIEASLATFEDPQTWERYWWNYFVYAHNRYHLLEAFEDWSLEDVDDEQGGDVAAASARDNAA